MVHILAANKRDLTQGVIWRKMLAFFIPLFMGNLLQQLYTTADAVIIGRFAGKDALASIDAIYNLIKFPTNFFMGLSAAATILVSQFYGAKDQESLSDAAHTAIAFSAVGGLLLSAAGLAVSAPAMRWLNVPREIIPATLSYIRIIFGGMITALAYNIGSGILRAVGDTRTPLVYLAVCNCANVALDLLFIGAFRWGVAGAAAATVASQCISAALVVRRLTRPGIPFRLRLGDVRFNGNIVGRITRMGLPMSFQNALYPVSNMALQSGVNARGVDSIAAWALCGKLDMMIWVACDALSDTTATFAAQNFGAKAFGRIRQGTRVGLVMGAIVIGAVSAALYVWRARLGGLIIGDRNVVAMGAELMRLIAPFYIVYALGEPLSGSMRGVGDTFRPMLVTLIATCGLRLLWAVFFPARGSLAGLIAAYPVSWAAATGSLAALYFIRSAANSKKAQYDSKPG
ncbi:MAG: MATE family efflux transporter [Oscillospiraceae bacterium]|jgi:putative MATE family efflux protein|nr:MATE family efflux transporter [Oscillospiraceae bacterium]